MTSVRTIILAVLFTVTATAPAASQIGIVGGWSYSTVSASDGGVNLDTGYRNGYHMGVTYGGEGFLGFMAEALYTRKGFSTGEGTAETAVDLGYFEIPIMLVVNLPLMRGYAGGNVGFEVNCSAQSGTDFSCDDQTASFDFGFKGGAGIQFLMFTIDAALTYGISNISSVEGLDMKNRTLYISAGIVLAFL